MMKFFAYLNAKQLAFKNAFNGLLPSILLNLIWVPVLSAFISAVLGVVVNNVLGPAAFSTLFPVIALAPILLVSIYAVILVGKEYQHRETRNAHRGRLMLKEEAARREAGKKRTPGDPGVLWGKLRLPTEDAMMHFCIVGAIGSGKTLTMQILMNDQLKLLTPGSDRRAMIFDSKEDFVQIVAGIAPPCPLHILNPFDKRRTAWNIAQDIDYAPIAANLSAMVFPISPNTHNKFYEETPQTIMTSVLEVFIERANGKWTLRHLVLVMQSKVLIQQITNLEPQARATMKLTFEGSDKSLGDVMSTINSKLAPWARIAASWETAKKKISIKKWLKETSVLVLPKYGAAESETFRIYSMFINIMSSNLSMLSRSEARRTWVFLDEVTQLGKVDGLQRLVLEGRDKGFTCVIGTQQPGLVHATYGREEGEALISECANKCYLKASSDAAATWAANSVNEFAPDWDQSEDSQDPDNSFPPRYFMTLPKAGFTNGLSGVYLGPSIAGWSAHYTPTELRSLVCPPNTNIERFQRLDPEFLKLKPWNEADSKLFGISWPTSDHPIRSEQAAVPEEPQPSADAPLKDNPVDQVQPFRL